VISYKSALAQALMGKKIGDQLKAPTEHGERIVEILKIETFRAAAVAA
jgi:transcription elongation GreA/GreB family factor